MPPLWTPLSARPAYKCNVCGEQFFGEEQEKWARHVAKCARKHREELEEAAAFNRSRNPLEGAAVDQEAVEFQRKRYGTG